MGDRASEFLKIVIILVACIAFISLAFTLFKLSQVQSNNSYNDLVTQIDVMNNLDINSLNQEIISGANVKTYIDTFSNKDMAVILVTKNLVSSQLEWHGKENEGTISGNYKIDVGKGAVPFVGLEGRQMSTALGTELDMFAGVNVGTKLKNSVLNNNGDESSFVIQDDKFQFVGYDETTEYGQMIRFNGTEFITKLDFMTDKTGRMEKYDLKYDYDKKGRTLCIDDTALFNSYLLKNVSGDIMGVVFIQE